MAVFDNDPPVTFEKSEKTSPVLRLAEITGGTAAFVVAHRLAIKRIPGFSESAYNLFHAIEERSPGRILRTFGLGELYSSYLPQTLEIAHKDVFTGADFSGLGEHLQRLLGNNYDLRSLQEGTSLKFTNAGDGSAYMKLGGAEHIRVRFFKAEEVGGKLTPGKLAGASQRLGAKLQRPPIEWLHPSSIKKAFSPAGVDLTNWQKIKGVLHRIGEEQRPQAVYNEVLPAVYGEGLRGSFIPGAVHISGKFPRNLAKSAELVSFEMGERAQVLLSDVRLGVWRGTYNRLAHLPFFGGESRGLINELLTKRTMPIYAGALALGFANYLTKHAISNTAIDLYQQARIAHAKLTDTVPGARKITDKYEQLIPGAQYGPLALPLAGLTVGSLLHYSKVAAGTLDAQARTVSARIFAKLSGAGVHDTPLLGIFNKKSPLAIGLVAGLAAMLPFVPGMLGSRETSRELQDIYSGKEPVPIRSGRWWDLGTTPWEGNRIKEYRPHWTVLHKAHAEEISLYGSEEEYWQHQPLLHPFRWFKDPYWLERKHYEDRPYPITSPAFSNVPLIGPLLAATIGKIIKPPVRMHPEWTGEDYNVGSSRLRPKGPSALPPAAPKSEFGLKDTLKREALQFSELIGLPGFIARTLYGNAFPNQDLGKDVYFQGSRAMESISRRYYEKELGAGLGPNPDLTQTLGYSEPLRRFIQPEPQRVTANEIPNTMPSWLPGQDYFLNFRVGDPYAKIAEGYARLPGAGYEALHPEVAGTNPDDYPDLVKMSILGDVAPYSIEYRRAEAKVRREIGDNTEAKIQYQNIVNRVEEMKRSVVRTDDRKFSREIAKTTATIKSVDKNGIELEEYPGRVFNLSSVGYTAADQSAIILGEHNDWTTEQVAREVEQRQGRLAEFLSTYLKPGAKTEITTPAYAIESQESVQAVFDTQGTNVNKSLITEGLARYRKDLGGPESQAMFGWAGRVLGRIAEETAFTGDESRLNPLRYVPTPGHTKLWQERTAIAQYEQQEVEGSRLRRWQHPIEDFLMPYLRGAYRRTIGDPGVPDITKKKWDLNTVADMLEYVRGLQLATTSPKLHGRYTNQASRTATGANLFGNPTFIASTLPGRDAAYFKRFLEESDPNERRKILSKVPPEMAKALSAQWIGREAAIAKAEGASVPELGEGGRLYSKEGLEEYSKADTRLNYGDFQRSKEVAEFFASQKLNLPEEADSPLYDPAIDYEDVKLKIIQQEGYDAHDFGLFDDRAAVLWRKPYVDGAIRELTGPNRKSVEEVRRSIEELILAAHDKNPRVVVTSNQANKSRSNVRVDVNLDQSKELLRDMRRNPEAYQ